MWREVIFFSNTSVFIYTHTQIKKKIIFFLIPRTRDTLTFFFTFSTLTFVFILNTCPHFTYFMFLSFLQFFLFTIHFNIISLHMLKRLICSLNACSMF